MDAMPRPSSFHGSSGSFKTHDLLPYELWCDIWKHLHLCDRVSVAQVCRNWRDVCMHTTSLWTRLDFYTTRHYSNCRCKDCFRYDPQNALHDSGWINSPYPENSSNLSLVRSVLERSGDLALHIHLDIVPYAPDTISGLAKALVSHSSRIASISAVAPTTPTMSHILSYFKCLPALCTYCLSVAPGCAEDMWRHAAYFVSHPIDLPRLAVLDLREMGALEWPDNLYSPLHFPALRVLGFRTILMRNVVFALRACPSVSSLHIKLAATDHMAHAYYGVSAQELRDALESVQNCRVDGIRRAAENWVLAGFAGAGHTSLELRYLDFPARGFGILANAAFPSAIGLSLTDNGLVAVTADGARTRRLIFPADPEAADQVDFWRIWESVHLVDGVRRATSDDAMWSDFVDMLVLSSPPAEHD